MTWHRIRVDQSYRNIPEFVVSDVTIQPLQHLLRVATDLLLTFQGDLFAYDAILAPMMSHPSQASRAEVDEVVRRTEGLPEWTFVIRRCDSLAANPAMKSI